jgi:protein arginine kinase activator
MNCEKCKKNRATLHVTAKENDVMREIHLCEECARQTGVNVSFNFTIGGILGSLMEPPASKSGKSSHLKCSECGITYPEFKTKARLGCAEDYEVFKAELLRLLDKIHGSTTHAGKTPHTVDSQVRKENELIRLKRDLESVVKAEDFEKAAQIRDRIKTLEHDLSP